jgi:hypothetical protein
VTLRQLEKQKKKLACTKAVIVPGAWPILLSARRHIPPSPGDSALLLLLLMVMHT